MDYFVERASLWTTLLKELLFMDYFVGKFLRASSLILVAASNNVFYICWIDLNPYPLTNAFVLASTE